MENGPEDLRKAPVQHSHQTPADHPRLHLHRHQARPGRHDRAPRRDPRHPLDATHPHDHLTTPALTKPSNTRPRHARERSALNVYLPLPVAAPRVELAHPLEEAVRRPWRLSCVADLDLGWGIATAQLAARVAGLHGPMRSFRGRRDGVLAGGLLGGSERSRWRGLTAGWRGSPDSRVGRRAPPGRVQGAVPAVFGLEHSDLGARVRLLAAGDTHRGWPACQLVLAWPVTQQPGRSLTDGAHLEVPRSAH